MLKKLIAQIVPHSKDASGKSVQARPLLKATENKGKKQFSVFGNCQADPLGSILQTNKDFNDEYDFVPFAQPAFALRAEHVEQTMAQLANTDVLITQNVSEKFGVYSTRNLIANLKPGARVIRVPNIYFSGYTPEITYFRAAEPHVTAFCDYHDANFLKFYFENPATAVKKSVAAYSDETFYSDDFVLTNAHNSLQELRHREMDCDVTISDFIQANWQSDVLFYSMNHPKRKLLAHVASQILQGLSIPSTDITGQYEHLDNTKLPVYRSIGKALGTTKSSAIQIKGEAMDIETYYANHARVLDGIDQDFLQKAYQKFLKTSSSGAS